MPWGLSTYWGLSTCYPPNTFAATATAGTNASTNLLYAYYYNNTTQAFRLYNFDQAPHLIQLYLRQDAMLAQQALAQQAAAFAPAAPNIQPSDARERAFRERQQAAEVANELLLSFLTPEQREELARHSYFTVKTRRGRLFRIERGIVANVIELRARARGDQVPLRRLCIHPDNALVCPVEDTMLAQLLHINDNEEDFIRRANVHLIHRS